MTNSLEFSVEEGLNYGEYPILVVGDDPAVLDLVVEDFGKDFLLEACKDFESALEILALNEFSVVICYQREGAGSGAALLERTVERHPHLVRILIAERADKEGLLQAINLGRIYHYVIRPWAPDELKMLLKRAIERYALDAHNRRLLADLKQEKLVLKKRLQERTHALEQATERFRKLAISDGLTGLYNHRYFQERWRREVQHAQRYEDPLSLMILDVDYFKNFNDTMGHPEGDTLLRELAGLLSRSVREVDLVARYGGEEFVVVLPKAEKSNATVLAERVRALVGQHRFEHRDVQPGGRVTVSIGVASYPEDGVDASELVIAADQALYRAKRAGRDCVREAGGLAQSLGADAEEDQDMDLIVEEDGETREAGVSATDLPQAATIDTLRLRAVRDEDLETEEA